MQKLIILIIISAALISGCAMRPNPVESPQQQMQESAKVDNQESKKIDRYEWKKVNEMTDNAGNKICAYKIAGDSEWWDIVVIYDNEGVIKQVMSKQFR